VLAKGAKTVAKSARVFIKKGFHVAFLSVLGSALGALYIAQHQ
jgi:hypothetical protein